MSGKAIDPDEALAEIFGRYLTAYGPATTTDVAQWFAGHKLPPDEARKLAESIGGELEEVKLGRRRACSELSMLIALQNGPLPA
ncbi:MAG TPA: crosslink repair DNA glycosylase YcaQ family protein [Ktedonobacterales bacterium]|jgi:hypothetical protein|nr:crosslink repair DNA glycosylase YcaQ family protein [Ktedonobacterales bacterium]